MCANLQVVVWIVFAGVPPATVERELVVRAVDCFVDGFVPVGGVDVPVDVGWNFGYDEFCVVGAGSVLEGFDDLDEVGVGAILVIVVVVESMVRKGFAGEGFVEPYALGRYAEAGASFVECDLDGVRTARCVRG